ncbi:MAG TPA: NUDIX hydrolase [Terriglobales bacterium]|jgi:8-oxo-dGTP diphosphatase|nr:NUDIX hydrolase [Terriglobales bacterium]
MCTREAFSPNDAVSWIGLKFTVKRDYPDRPLLGVGAVIVRNDQVLVVRRANPPLQGQWSIPGGLVDTGETTKEAVLREIREETSLTIEPIELIEVFERILRDADSRVQYHYVVIDYLCRLVSGEPSPGSDVSEARWAKFEDLQLLGITPETTSVIHKALNAATKSSAFRTDS